MIRQRTPLSTLLMAVMLGIPMHVSANSNAGTSGAAFLEIGPGARPAGLGQAYTGVADDVDAIYWNPAGLARIQHPELEAMHTQYFQNIGYEYAAFAYPTQTYGTWGFAISNLHTNDIQARTQDTDTAAGSFDAVDSAYWLTYAYPLTAKLSVGANAKWIRQSLNSVVANAYAADGGLRYDTGWRNLRLGAAVQNLGTSVKFNSVSDPLPLTYRFGASAPLFSPHFLFSSDVVLPRDSSAALAFGGEYTKQLLNDLSCAFRSGYQTGSSVDGLSGVSVGGGLTYGRTSFDFAWVPFGELGNTYRYALHIKFGDVAAPSTAPKRLQKTSMATSPDSSLESLLTLQ